MPDSRLSLQLAGEHVQLLGARALYWPARQALMIADPHLGKADVFRRAGIGLPAGGTGHDLQRLHAVLQAQPVTTLWILGDVLHGPVSAAAWLGQWSQWRQQHPGLAIHAIHGNHDRALARAELGLSLVGEAVQLGPFLLRHEPHPDPHLHVLCGHVHPVAQLPGIARRWPAFWLRNGMTVLPAYSHFTAGVVPQASSGERLVACVEGAAIGLPPG